MKKGIIFSILISISCASFGFTESISVSEMNHALNAALSRQSEIGSLIGDRVALALENANIKLDQNGLIYTIDDRERRQLRGGCSANVRLNRVFGTVRFDGDTRFDLTLDALSKPIIVSADVYADVDVTGKITARYGTMVFGHCVKYQKDHITANVKADVSFNLNLVIKLNPELIDNHTVRITPTVYLSGGVHKVSNKQVNIRGFDWVGSYIVGGVFGAVINGQIAAYGERTAEGELNVGRANEFMAEFLARQNESLNQQVQDSIGGVYRDYRFPNIDLQQAKDIASIVNREFITRIPIAWEFINNIKESVLFNLLTGDREELESILGIAACRATLDAQPSMVAIPLYRKNGSVCTAEYNPSASGQRYSDSQCNKPVAFSNTSSTEFCSTIVQKDWLGNADPSVSGYSGKSDWTLLPSTTLNLSVVSPITGNAQPYVQKVKYRTIENVIDGHNVLINYERYIDDAFAGNYRDIDYYTTYVPIPRGTGTCELEMRVYKKNIGQTNLKPLIAIHGGAWRFRGAAFYGLESQISQFTEDGFVVFSPFYRLTDDSDGNKSCNGASGEDILSDVSAALAWVQTNKADYGVAGGEKIRLYGQSAGAQLAAWLMTYHQCEVDSAVLMYPPTDAVDYMEAYQDFAAGLPVESDYYGHLTELGYSSLESFLQPKSGDRMNLEDIPLDDDLAQHITYTTKIAENPSLYPPAFLIHGRQDSLVPSVQSVRLCNAFAGSPEYGPAVNDGSQYRKIYQCGQSTLHILEEADHMLELCLPPLKCEAGSSQGAMDAAASSILAARNFLKTAHRSGGSCSNTIEPGSFDGVPGDPADEPPVPILTTITTDSVTKNSKTGFLIVASSSAKQFCIDEGYENYTAITSTAFSSGGWVSLPVVYHSNGTWKFKNSGDFTQIKSVTCVTYE